MCWQNVTDTAAYWTEVCLYEDVIGENPYKNWLVLRNAYYVANTTLLCRNGPSIRPDKHGKIKIEQQNECRTGKCNFEYQDWIKKRQYYKTCYDYDSFEKQ